MPSPVLPRHLALKMVAGSIAGAGLFGPLTARAGAADPVVLRVGAIAIDPCAPLFAALAHDEFKRAGLDVRIELMNNGGAISTAVAAGALDVGLGDAVSVSSGHARGLPFKYVVPAAVFTPQSPGHALLVKPSSPIKTAKDFEGKTIAVNALGGFEHTTNLAWLSKNGCDWHTVKYIELPFAAMPQALESDRVDAIQLTEPGWSLTNERFRSFALGDNGVANRFLVSGYVATKDAIEKNGDALRRFARVVANSNRWANANHAASVPIMAKYSKSSPEVLAKMERSFFVDRLTPELIQPIIDVSVKFGVFAKTFPAAEIIADAGPA